LRLQRRRWNTEPGSSPASSRHLSSTLRQSGLDHFFLLILQRRGEWPRPVRAKRRLSREPRFVNRKRIADAEDDGTLYDVLQLADVPGPWISLAELQRPLVDLTDTLRHFLGESFDEVFDKNRNVLWPFAKRRDVDGKDVQPVEQIRSECARRDGCGQIA